MKVITVKEVNGYKVQKYEGQRSNFFVNIKEGTVGGFEGWREFHTFRTIKAAVEFIETAL